MRLKKINLYLNGEEISVIQGQYNAYFQGNIYSIVFKKAENELIITKAKKEFVEVVSIFNPTFSIVNLNPSFKFNEKYLYWDEEKFELKEDSFAIFKISDENSIENNNLSLDSAIKDRFYNISEEKQFLMITLETKDYYLINKSDILESNLSLDEMYSKFAGLDLLKYRMGFISRTFTLK